MSSLLWSTFEMMVLTFAIGFFVAGLIKLMARWADVLNLYGTHKQELLRLKRLKKIRTHVLELLTQDVMDKYDGDGRKSFKSGYDPNNKAEVKGFYHETSQGVEKNSILDYYYPDTKRLFLESAEKAKDERKAGASATSGTSVNSGNSGNSSKK